MNTLQKKQSKLKRMYYLYDKAVQRITLSNDMRNPSLLAILISEKTKWYTKRIHNLSMSYQNLLWISESLKNT